MKDYFSDEGVAKIIYAALLAIGFVFTSAAHVIRDDWSLFDEE